MNEYDEIEEEIKNGKTSKNKKNMIKVENGEKNRKRFPFSRQEDQKLLELVKLYDPNKRDNWHSIAQQLIGRNPRQCRERYNLYLKKGNRTKVKWTTEEDELLISKFLIYGAHWKMIEKFFKGRNSYSIKNRFNSLKHKMEMNEIKSNSMQNDTKTHKNHSSSQNISLENNLEIDNDDIFFDNADDFSFQFDFEDYDHSNNQYFI